MYCFSSFKLSTYTCLTLLDYTLVLSTLVHITPGLASTIPSDLQQLVAIASNVMLADRICNADFTKSSVLYPAALDNGWTDIGSCSDSKTG